MSCKSCWWEKQMKVASLALTSKNQMLLGFLAFLLNTVASALLVCLDLKNRRVKVLECSNIVWLILLLWRWLGIVGGLDWLYWDVLQASYLHHLQWCNLTWHLLKLWNITNRLCWKTHLVPPTFATMFDFDLIIMIQYFLFHSLILMYFLHPSFARSPFISLSTNVSFPFLFSSHSLF